jgi:hypothetical protein
MSFKSFVRAVGNWPVRERSHDAIDTIVEEIQDSVLELNIPGEHQHKEIFVWESANRLAFSKGAGRPGFQRTRACALVWHVVSAAAGKLAVVIQSAIDTRGAPGYGERPTPPEKEYAKVAGRCNQRQSFAVVDLFAGCGGFSLGMHLAGFRTALAIDLDPTLSSSYRINFPGVPHLLADLSGIDLTSLRANMLENERVAGIVGGPPCQGFSEIGPRRHDDPRNELVWHFFRHVAAVRPKFFVMENVRGLGSRNRRPALEAALELAAPNTRFLAPSWPTLRDMGRPRGASA